MLKRLISLMLLLTALMLSVTSSHAQTPVDVTTQTAGAREMLNQAMQAYRKGSFQEAYKLSRAAYLDYFEQIEPPLRVVNQDMTLDMEYRFADLRTKMQNRKPPEQVEPSTAKVREGLIEIDGMFGGVGVLAPLIAFSSSFAIAIREGLEALLVIGTLLGALRAGQRQGLGRYVLGGAALAVLASMAVWSVLHTLISTTPLAAQVISAVASLAAVGTLLWVNVWLLRRLDSKRWMETMRARAWAAMASGSAAGLVVIGFSAVFRQGIETALLYEVLVGYSQGVVGYVGLGALIAVVALIGLAALLTYGGYKVSPRAFLRVAVSLLMLLSVAFVGGAVDQLQQSGYLPLTSAIRNFPRLPYFVASLTGIHPTIESLGAQAVLILVYGVIWIGLRARRPAALTVRSVTP